MFPDAPYWRPPSRALSMVFQTYGLEARFWIASGWATTHPESPNRSPQRDYRMCDPRNLATSITESCNEIQNSDKTLSGYTPAAGREGYA